MNTQTELESELKGLQDGLRGENGMSRRRSPGSRTLIEQDIVDTILGILHLNHYNIHIARLVSHSILTVEDITRGTRL